MELAFENIVTIADGIENLFSEIIKSSIVKVTYENYVIKFNECLKLIIESYENKNNKNFIMILENKLIELIKNVKTQLEIAE